MKHQGFLSTSDKPHYENEPFEVPSSWVWTTLGEIFTLQAGKNITAKDIYTEKSEEYKYPCFGGNGIRGYVAISNKIGEYPIIGRQGALCGNINLAHGSFYATEHAVVVERYCDTDLMWGYYTLIALNLNQYATATAQPGLAVNVINNVAIPLPPLHEQQRISKSIKILFSFLDAIECEKLYLKTAISQTKTKVLDLAIHGRLVPQDPTDEPASELLKRINPNAEITSDNGHYQKLPEGWCETTLKHVLTIKSGNSINVRNCTQGHYPIYGGNGITGHTDDYNIKESTIVIGRVGYYCGSVYLVRGKAWVSDNAFITTIHKDIFYKKYLYYLLQFLNLRKFSNSTAQPVISGKTIYPIHVLIPPIREQKSIVAKIEEIFAPLNAIEASL